VLLKTAAKVSAMTNRTLRKMVVVPLLLFGFAFGAKASIVMLVPTSNTSLLIDGDVISFDVMIDFSRVGGTLGGGLDITFNPNDIGLVSVTSAGLGDPDFGRDPDIMEGLLQSWAVGDFDGLGTSGPELLGRVQFEVLSTMGLGSTLTVSGTNGIAGPWISGQDFESFLIPTYNQVKLRRGEAPLNGGLNPGLNDAWYYQATNGQGFFINVFPNIAYVSLSWFTYETERPPDDVTANLGEPGHRWLLALGPYVGNQAVMDVSITAGGVFDTATEVEEVNDGTIILTFSDCENGTVEYDIPSIDRQGIVPIKRVVGDNIALCEVLDEATALQQVSNGKGAEDSNIRSSGAPVPEVDPEPLVQMNAGLNDAWFYQVTNGQGFFINVFPDIAYVSLSWFTYETERPPDDVTANLGEPGHRWVMALGPYIGNQALMDVSITTGGVFDTPTEVTEVNDGSIILTFTDCENGTVEYDITSINRQGTVPIRRVVGDNIALCETLNQD
jgi:hypothetical protein